MRLWILLAFELVAIVAFELAGYKGVPQGIGIGCAVANTVLLWPVGTERDNADEVAE